MNIHIVKIWTSKSHKNVFFVKARKTYKEFILLRFKMLDVNRKIVINVYYKVQISLQMFTILTKFVKILTLDIHKKLL